MLEEKEEMKRKLAEEECQREENRMKRQEEMRKQAELRLGFIYWGVQGGSFPPPPQSNS